MKEQNPIHVRIGYEEAIQSKKDLLSSEGDFIRILKTIKKYRALRERELNSKLKIQKKMKELKLNLGKINEAFPKIKTPSIIKKDLFREKTSSKKKEEKIDNDLESQLKEIQERLRKLG